MGFHAASLTSCIPVVKCRAKPRDYFRAWNSDVGGELAQMVECSLSMREVTGSIPVFSIKSFACAVIGAFCYLWAV